VHTRDAREGASYYDMIADAPEQVDALRQTD
jgi:hypothetical protein